MLPNLSLAPRGLGDRRAASDASGLAIEAVLEAPGPVDELREGVPGAVAGAVALLLPPAANEPSPEPCESAVGKGAPTTEGDEAASASVERSTVDDVSFMFANVLACYEGGWTIVC